MWALPFIVIGLSAICTIALLSAVSTASSTRFYRKLLFLELSHLKLSHLALSHKEPVVSSQGIKHAIEKSDAPQNSILA